MCTRIDTDVLLAYLFAVDAKCDSQYSFAMIREYLRFLSDRFPTYITTDLSKDKICECVANHPKLYTLCEKDGELFIAAGELIPNIDYFATIYPDDTKNYIKRLTTVFVKKQIQI